MKPPSATQRAALKSFFLLVAVLLALTVWEQTKPVYLMRWSGQVMGGPYTILVRDRVVNDGVKKMLDSDFPDFMSKMEDRFSRAAGLGLVAEFNSSTSTLPAIVGSEIWRVVDVEKRLNNASGVSDITMASLEDVWKRVQAGNISAPAPRYARGLLAESGMAKLYAPAEPYIRKLRPELKLSLDTVAAGYVADRAVVYMTENKIKNFFINIGGVVVANGDMEQSLAVSVCDVPVNGAPAPKVVLNSRAMATAGRYDGLIHVDPRTGLPVSNEVCCVTVIAENGLTAKALANALYLLGPKAGITLTVNNDISTVAESIFLIEKPGGGFTTVQTEKFPIAMP